MEYANATVSSEMENKVLSFQKQGKTVSYLAVDGQVSGDVVIGDRDQENQCKGYQGTAGRGHRSDYVDRR